MIRPCLQFICRGAATSRDVSSRTIRTSEAENTFTSSLPGLDQPSNQLSMSTCWWPHDWLQNNLSSSGSGNLHCRADAGADEPFERAINESVTFTQRSTSAAAGADHRHRERAVLAEHEIDWKDSANEHVQPGRIARERCVRSRSTWSFPGRPAAG